MKHLLSLFAFTLLFSSALIAQKDKGNNKTSKADKAFLVQNYYEAEALYKKQYTKEKNRAKKAELIFLQAECARLIGTPIHVKKAESMYKRAIKAKYPHAEVYLKYGMVLQQQAKYSEAIEQYRKYNELKPDDDRALKGVESCFFALECLEIPTRFEVEQFLFNSNAADYAASFLNSDYDELYFTSTREGASGKDTDGFSGKRFSDLFASKLEKSKRDPKVKKWSKPVPAFNGPNKDLMNTGAHEAAPSFSRRGNEMFFTRCNESTKKKPFPTCEIYYSKKKGKGWIAPVLLPLPYDSLTTFGHPSLSKDGKVLYFSSDLKGGFGGKDIWYIKKVKRDEWSEPVNLGELVNTSGNELYPFSREDGSLYFSSDGHIGMGGMDIFKAEYDDENNLRKVINMKSPLNSAADDFAIIFEGLEERGFFTSNRTGSKGDDLYQFVLPKLDLTLSGVVTDVKTESVLSGVKVSIIGTDNSSFTTMSDNAGRFIFGNDKIEEGVAYEITFEKEGYLSSTILQSTQAIFESMDIVKDITLEPTRKEILLPKIEYDFNSSDLREDSRIALSALVEILKDNPNVVIQLRSHTDNRDTDEFNLKLSQERAQKCVDYMVEKGLNQKRLKPVGMGESEPYVMEEKDGKLKLGDILDPDYIDGLRRKKDKEKAHQYNRRTDFKVLKDLFYDIESGKIVQKEK